VYEFGIVVMILLIVAIVFVYVLVCLPLGYVSLLGLAINILLIVHEYHTGLAASASEVF
jgi:hypothetical protein